MPALIIAYDKDDKKIAQCDAKCYDAVSQRCTCICGGINHGQHLRLAADRVLHGPLPISTEALDLKGKKIDQIKKHHDLSRLSHPTLFDL